jgi:hypothetical protein
MTDGYGEYLEWKYREQARLRKALECADVLLAGTREPKQREHIETQKRMLRRELDIALMVD